MSKLTKRLGFTAGLFAVLAIIGNPLWLFRGHDELSRDELATDYFMHGFASATTLALAASGLAILWMEVQIAKRAVTQS